MAEEAQRQSRYRWIGIAVVAVALLGWLLALYFWTAYAEAENELERHVGLTGTATEIETRVVALRDEAAQAEIEREQGLGALDEVNQRLQEVRAEVAALEEQAQALRQERQTLEAELVEGRDELAGIESGLVETQQAVTDTTQELAEVGERIEEARRREAELQSTIADLTAEVSRLSEEASDAEERVQMVRDAEASLERRVAEARQELETMEGTRETLEQSVATLVERREDLAADTGAAEEQMQALQDMVVELSQTLAERSEHLAALETRIAEMQQRAGASARAEAAGLVPGARYVHDDAVTASFDAEGRFHMTNLRSAEAVVGAYTLEDDVLTLSDAEGDLRAAEFPMRCGIVSEASGFVLQDTDGSCALLAGAAFEHAN